MRTIPPLTFADSPLRTLTIRDTHLGHEGWTTIPVTCRLQVLDIGSCYDGDEDLNTRRTERIVAAVGPTVDAFSLIAAVSDTIFSEGSVTRVQRLRKLHITPFSPVDNVVETMWAPIFKTSCNESTSR